MRFNFTEAIMADKIIFNEDMQSNYMPIGGMTFGWIHEYGLNVSDLDVVIHLTESLAFMQNVKYLGFGLQLKFITAYDEVAASFLVDYDCNSVEMQKFMGTLQLHKDDYEAFEKR
ncbi:MAG: hypothetical protein ACI9TY_000939 [Alphaproteobacteria bacterium]|jgi:hypothetical protein